VNQRTRAWLVKAAVIGAITLLAPSRANFAQDVPAKDATRTVVDERTQKVVDSALRFLISRQNDNGSWAIDRADNAAAVTAYVLHSFMASGHLPGQGPYGKELDRGLDFLVGCVRGDGFIGHSEGAANMYGHGIATIVLGELLGERDDPQLRAAVERAVKLIISAQNDRGGWRYDPRPADADISVTVLQVVALRVARNSGVAVPQEVIDKAVQYVKKCYSDRAGGFTYQGHGHDAGFARTAAAVYSLQVCGLYDDPLVGKGIEYMQANWRRDQEWFAYGHFYAAPAMYMRGGQDWDEWYVQLRDRILESARSDGEFSFWRPEDLGRNDRFNDVLMTAVFAGILSVPYGYLPIYQR
jgi:prenyltransferase beta subunit